MKIGIDCGLSGALVVLNNRNDIVDYTIMPTITLGKTKRVDVAAVAEFLKNYSASETHVYVESVHAFPGQGVTSMFNFGHAAGSIAGVVGALGYPMTLVTPQRWKKNAGIIGKDKDESRSRCIQLYPTETYFSKKGEGQALADALLIARFGLPNG